MKSSMDGFSILELMIAIGVATVLSTVLIAFTLTYVADVYRSNTSAELAVESNFVLQTMIEDIRLADGVASTNTIEDVNAPTGGWVTSDLSNQLVVNSPATDSDRNIIYDESTGFPYRNQLIYFVGSGNLYKRTLKNTSAANNSTNTSCPTATTGCPADKNYSSHISDLSLQFFDTDNNPTSDLSSARSIKVGIVLSRKSFGKLITLNTSFQTTLRNY